MKVISEPVFLSLSLPLPIAERAGYPLSSVSVPLLPRRLRPCLNYFMGSEMKSLEKEQQKVKRHLSSGGPRGLERCVVSAAG